MLTVIDRYQVLPPYRHAASLGRATLLACTGALGLSLGGALDVQLTNRYLTRLGETTTPATFAIDAGTSLHYLDVLFIHTVAYGVVFLLACGAGLLVLAWRRATAAAAVASLAVPTRRRRLSPIGPTVATIFAVAVLSGGLFDRALTKWRFARANIASHVSTDAVLQPFYAYDALYQRLASATGIAVVVLWLGWMLLRRWWTRWQARGGIAI